MEKKRPAHIIHYYFKRLYKYSGEMKRGFKEDAIHHFRVEYKKLRAFLRMMVLMAIKPDHLKYPHRFKKTYKLAGKIRDRQLCMERIKKNKESSGRSSGKIDALKKEIKELSAKDAFLTKKGFEEMEEDIIKDLPVIFRGTLIKDFIQQKIVVINGIIMKGDYTDKELHGIRKSIKDTIYITTIFRDDLKVRMPLPVLKKTDLKKEEYLADLLGSFNDACIALSFLTLSEIKKTGAKEKESLRSIRRQWLAEKRKLKKDILNHIPEIKLLTA